MTSVREVRRQQAEFATRFHDQDDLATWLEQLVGTPGSVRCYGTSSRNPTQQLKNKLSQAAPASNGMLCLCVASPEAHELARDALVERWAGNSEWSKSVSCVAIAFPREGGAEIRTIVEWRPSSFPERVRELLFPDVEIVAAAESPAHGPLGSRAARQLAEALYLDDEWVEDTLWLLRDKRALVLYGPPGTGKTFIAQRLAEHLQADVARRALVQLHPTYGYEDFFEGYRPEVAAGVATLVKQRGPLRELAKLAADQPAEPVVLVMDEMNRGNLPRAFGELFFLLEYRDATASLMYSPTERFQLPKNLFLIGTMNTADRSIALLDQALRRRFHFAGLFPDSPPVKGMLRRYLDAHRPEMSWAADLLDEANRRLGDRHVAIGPSHLMRDDLDETVLRRVWRASILPSIEEHLFGQDAKVAQFDLDQLMAVIGRADATAS